ncbi:MAG: YqgE/AlgH family protein [Deltaproteobacteria bacterium]|nr:YqgE/AlgH family protein [Deltaproteobacteria bacterium]
MSELAPGLLIAVPQMDDPNFSRSVVLLLEHSDEGAMGIVFNRPSEVSLTDVGRAHGVKVPGGAGKAWRGGPVQPERGFLLHQRKDLEECVEVARGIYLSVSTDSLKELLSADPATYRLCLGYAGWGPGQLEKEVVLGGWLTGQANCLRVFETPHDKVWDLAIRDLGVDPAFLVPSGGPQ